MVDAMSEVLTIVFAVVSLLVIDYRNEFCEWIQNEKIPLQALLKK